jgi:hypothetical protein
MNIYKELYIYGTKEELDRMAKDIYLELPDGWTKPNNGLKNYILFDYVGNDLPHSEISIYYGDNYWRDGMVCVTNIVPLEKSQLDINEYNKILDLFYKEVIALYELRNEGLRVEGPTSDIFEPKNYISKEAIKKLELFCNAANKSTGSTHPCDRERWYDFICQTIEDDRIFDSDALYKFLKDEEYWGKKPDDFMGGMGRYAWSDEEAYKLACEYENNVEILQYYIKWKGID